MVLFRKTEFSITVIYKGKIKSGGHVKFDAAEIVNNNYASNHLISQMKE